MRILHAIADIEPQAGGTAATFIKLTAAQARAGLDVTAITTYRAGADLSGAHEMERAGVKVHLFGPGVGPSVFVWGTRKPIQQLIRGVDMVHVHGLWEEMQYRAAREARRLNVPYIYMPQGMLDPWSLAQKRLKKRLYMMLRLRANLEGATAIAVTAGPERDLIKPLGLPNKFVVEPLGVDLSEFQTLPERGWLRGRYPTLAGRPIVLFLGRLHHKKGLDLLLPAFAKADTKGAALVLAGPCDDSYRAELQSEVARHGLEDRVIFTGLLRDIERVQAYVDSDLFVLPSYQENFGIAVVEAAAAGCPVLISDRVNIWEDIRNAGVGGVIAPETGALVKALEYWMNNEAARFDAGQRGPAFARNRYDWAMIAERWSQHYAALLAPAPSFAAE
ncbi:MAG: hypothetical protein JWN04_3302 [Myxococcaceae bacterium]|nr:hypothetical protein [Myxococcaceae bacterium]